MRSVGEVFQHIAADNYFMPRVAGQAGSKGDRHHQGVQDGRRVRKTAHLGQLIAYARSNKITPPWSK